MDYDIYMYGEKCGELSAAEYACLRKAVRRDLRTWFAFASVRLNGTWKFINFFFRGLGLSGGLTLFAAAVFAPDSLQVIHGLNGEEVARFIQLIAQGIGVGVALYAVSCFVLFPNRFGVPDVFEDEFLRRVRRLKRIYRHGDLEVEPIYFSGLSEVVGGESDEPGRN
jgi:hypothetical protein